MSAEQATAAAASSFPGHRVRRALWVAQWFVVVLLPVWLVGGPALLIGDYWSVYLSELFAPVPVILMLVAAVLSVSVPSARRSHGGPWYVWLLVAAWSCAAVQPFLIEGDSAGGVIPSALERIGLSHQADYSWSGFLLGATIVLLGLASIAASAAGMRPPVGDGSDRTGARVFAVRDVRRVLWFAQWVVAVLLPVWLVFGTALISPGLAFAFLALFVVPPLLALLLLAAVLSVSIGPARRAHGAPGYPWLLVGAWACAAVLPFLIAGDGGWSSPSPLQRLGASSQSSFEVFGVFAAMCAALLISASAVSIASGVRARPGTGHQAKARQHLIDRLDELNSWRPDASSDDGPSRAAPGAGSRS